MRVSGCRRPCVIGTYPTQTLLPRYGRKFIDFLYFFFLPCPRDRLVAVAAAAGRSFIVHGQPDGRPTALVFRFRFHDDFL